MKRISALLVALLILCCAMSTTAFAAEEKAFWLTNYNDITAEGAGVIVTSLDALNGNTPGGWNNYYAFAPVEGAENVYEIKAIAIGIGVGTAVMPEIPEGGFVYSINLGNNYPALYEQDPNTYGWCAGLPNYTSTACTAMSEDVANWAIGDQLVISGLDLEGFTVPAADSSLEWYDAAYSCTATYSVYVAEGTEDPAESEAESAEDVESEAESVEDVESKEESKKEESKEESKKEESKATSTATSTATSVADDAEEGGSMIWIIVAVVAVVVVAVVVVVAKKKK